jgi:hypothetical protein
MSYALNRGEEYTLIDTNGSTSLVDPSNALTNALTGGIYFQDASTNDVFVITGSETESEPNSEATLGVIIGVTCTKIKSSDSLGLINPILKLSIHCDNSDIQGTLVENDIICIRHNYQTITKKLTSHDVWLLNQIFNK